MFRLYLLVLFISLGFLTYPLSYSKAPVPTSNDQNRIIVVLKDQPVLVYQKELSGSKTIHSARFQAKSAAAQLYADGIAAKQRSVETSIKQIDPTANVLNRMAHVINAMVVSMDASLQDQLRSIPEVKYTAPVTKVRPFLTRSHTVMNVEPAWEQVGGQEQGGEGIFIAVIDTGIDVTHPSFEDEGYERPQGFPKGNTQFTNNKVIAARTFPPPGTPQDDVTPDDTDGHGTNVASIAASNLVSSPLGLMSGVAPKAFLGNYKIFFRDGAGSDQVIAGINAAVQDGAHVLSMSFGSEEYADPQHDPQVEAVQNAIDMGVTCVFAAGNEGRPLMIGNPQQVEDAIAVAASQNAHNSSGDPNTLSFSAIIEDITLVLSNVNANFGFGIDRLIEPHIGTFRIQDVDVLDGGEFGGESDGLLCEDLPEDVRIDDWLLVRRGDCLFTDKVNRAQAAGAKGVIFYDNNFNQDLNTFHGVENTQIPSLIISNVHGRQLKTAIATGKEVFITIEPRVRETDPNKMASFSNLGPSVNFTVKPDISAIGLGSFGATQNDFNNSGEQNENGFASYTWLDGTSMATPRISGVAALVKQQHPDWPPAWIKSAIVLSATRRLTSPFSDNPAEIIKQGGGLADTGAALNIDTLVVPPIVGFGAQSVFANSSVSRWIEIVNTSGQEYTYSLFQIQTPNKPILIPSISQFILSPGESIHFPVTMQLNNQMLIQDHEVVLFLENLTTGEKQVIPTWVRLSNNVPPSGDILLVDDDEGRTFETFYSQLLSELGESFTRWDVNLQGEQYPNLSYLRNFKTVIWFMGEKSLNTLGDETSRIYLEAFNSRHLYETAMAQYLAEGGTLFLSGQDFMDDKESAMISREVLHTFIRDNKFTFPTIDRDATANTIQGVADNPVFNGLGPFELSFPDNFEDLSDRLFPDDDTAQPAFFSNGSQRRFVGMTVDACSYKAVFLAFPLEALNEADAGQVLSRSLDWFDEGVVRSRPKLASISPQQIELSDAPQPLQVEINGEGFALLNGYRAYLGDTALMDEARQSCSLLTATIPADMKEGTYTLRVVTGAGHQLVLPNAFEVIHTPPVTIENWEVLD